MKPASQIRLHDAVIEHLDSMSDEEEDEPWGIIGAFPGESPPKENCPTTKNDRMDEQAQKPMNETNFNATFRGTYESLEAVTEGSRETTTSSSQEGLMALSHSSSDTPSMSNTAASVREALQTKEVNAMKGCNNDDGNGNKNAFYPFNIYRSLSKDKQERVENANKQKKFESRAMPTRPSTSLLAAISNTLASSKVDDLRNSKQATVVGGEATLNEPNSSTAPGLPLIHGEDETSSAITDDNHHYHDQYLTSGNSSHDNRASSSASLRRPKGRNRQYWNRHGLSQQIATNPTILLKNLFIGIEAERQMHKLAAIHLRSIHNWILFLPSILLTLGAGAVVLIFEADLQTNDRGRVYASIAVGVASLLSVFWQALSRQLDLGTKATLHGSISISLKRLSEDVVLTLSAAETIPAEYVSLIGEKASQAIDTCTSPIPVRLDAAFSAMSDRMILMLRHPRKCDHNSVNVIRLFTTAYDELSAVIINSVGFPFLIPSPRSVCDDALRNFKAIITEGREAEGRRQQCFRCVCPCFRVPDEERSLFDMFPVVAELSGETKSNYPARNSMLGTSV